MISLIFVLLQIVLVHIFAQSIEGEWKTIDDKSGKS